MPDVHVFLIYVLSYIGLFATSFYIVSIFTYYRKKFPLSSEIKSVTILIPAYNEQKGIEGTIKSALAIDYPKDKFEIIVIDDGSKDDTLKLAKKYESNPQVSVFSKKNGGKGSALNFGIKLAKGEIVFSMDADTYVQRDAVKKMISYFYNDKVMSVTPSMGVYKPKGFLQRVQQIEYYMGVFLRKSFASVNSIHITPGAFSAYRKKFFDKYGGYDVGNITEDLEIALRIQSKHYIIENAPDAVIYTDVPSSFRSLLVQRKRWYTGLVRNLWRYKRLYGFKYGALGSVVLPVAAISISLSVILVTYMVMRTLNNISWELSSLSSVGFRFNSIFEADFYVIQNFFLDFFSQPINLISLSFIILVAFYLYFSRKKMKYTEGIKLSFVFFVATYSLLFAFWWIVSFIYLIFNKEVIWREENG